MIKSPQFVTDEKGHRIGVMLSMKSYEKLISDSEDTCDVKAYNKVKPKIHAEISRGQFSTFAAYKARRLKA
jgi:hypothetical protein